MVRAVLAPGTKADCDDVYKNRFIGQRFCVRCAALWAPIKVDHGLVVP